MSQINITRKLAIVSAAVVVAFIALAQESVSEYDTMILKLNKQITALKKQNPKVAYAETENPTINIQKGMKKTFVNHTFMCPLHKGFSYENGKCNWRVDAYGRPVPCKAQAKYLEWKRLVDSIPETERIEAEIESLQNQVDELKKTRSSLIGASKSTEKKEVQSKLTINLKRSSVQKLLEDGVVENAKMKIVLVDD